MRVTTRCTRRPKAKPSGQYWVDAGIELLIEAGIGAVKVEALAAALDVRRGAFWR